RSFMDGFMEIETVYTTDRSGHFSKCIPFGASTSQSKQCPECRMPISRVQRYGRVIKRAVLDTMLRGLIIRSQLEYLKLSREFDELEMELNQDREEHMNRLRAVVSEIQKRPIAINNANVMTQWMERFLQ